MVGDRLREDVGGCAGARDRGPMQARWFARRRFGALRCPTRTSPDTPAVDVS